MSDHCGNGRVAVSDVDLVLVREVVCPGHSVVIHARVKPPVRPVTVEIDHVVCRTRKQFGEPVPRRLLPHRGIGRVRHGPVADFIAVHALGRNLAECDLPCFRIDGVGTGRDNVSRAEVLDVAPVVPHNVLLRKLEHRVRPVRGNPDSPVRREPVDILASCLAAVGVALRIDHRPDLLRDNRDISVNRGEHRPVIDVVLVPVQDIHIPAEGEERYLPAGVNVAERRSDHDVSVCVVQVPYLAAAGREKHFFVLCDACPQPHHRVRAGGFRSNKVAAKVGLRPLRKDGVLVDGIR